MCGQRCLFLDHIWFLFLSKTPAYNLLMLNNAFLFFEQSKHSKFFLIQFTQKTYLCIFFAFFIVIIFFEKNSIWEDQKDKPKKKNNDISFFCLKQKKKLKNWKILHVISKFFLLGIFYGLPHAITWTAIEAFEPVELLVEV